MKRDASSMMPLLPAWTAVARAHPDATGRIKYRKPHSYPACKRPLMTVKERQAHSVRQCRSPARGTWRCRMTL